MHSSPSLCTKLVFYYMEFLHPFGSRVINVSLSWAIFWSHSCTCLVISYISGGWSKFSSTSKLILYHSAHSGSTMLNFCNVVDASFTCITNLILNLIPEFCNCVTKLPYFLCQWNLFFRSFSNNHLIYHLHYNVQTLLNLLHFYLLLLKLQMIFLNLCMIWC